MAAKWRDTGDREPRDYHRRGAKSPPGGGAPNALFGADALDLIAVTSRDYFDDATRRPEDDAERDAVW